MRWLVGLARPVWGLFGLGVLAGAGALSASVGLLAASAWLVSRAAQHPPVLHLTVAIVAVRAFGIGRGVLRYAERVTTHDAAFRILADTRVRVYRALERLAPAGLPAFRRGDLLGRLVADVDDVQDLFIRALLPPVIAVAVSMVAVGISATLMPLAGVILGVSLLVAGVAAPLFAAALTSRTDRRLAAVRGQLTASIVELLRGAPELVAYGAAPASLAELELLDARLRRIAARSASSGGVAAAVTTLATGAAVLGALLVGVPAVRAGQLDVVNLAVIVLLPLAAFEAVAGLPLAVQQVQRVRRSAARIQEVLTAPAPVADPVEPRTAPSGPYTLAIKGLSARWPGAQQAAVAGVDLLLTPGRRVAVVGASGAGKSTLAAALLRFVESDGAALNGVPIAELDADALRRVIGLCAQDAHLFDSTIGENLLLARPEARACLEVPQPAAPRPRRRPAALSPRPDTRNVSGRTSALPDAPWNTARSAMDFETGPGADTVRDALRRARLLDWVDALPAGLDTQVGEHGEQLSGGQRQRIALARALLADFPILILDEPAANLDIATADALTADLLDATLGRTTLLITHRLSGLETVDEVVVLDAGRVVERGTHAELLAAGGWYARQFDRERLLATV